MSNGAAHYNSSLRKVLKSYEIAFDIQKTKAESNVLLKMENILNLS